MDMNAHIDALSREGELLASAADAAGPDAAVPPCPGWQVRDLVRHTGRTHRWAAATVVAARPEPLDEAEVDAAVGPYPGDADLVEWFRKGHDDLLAVLRAAPPDTACFSFFPAPSPLAFWARRQAHETAVHRIDAQSSGESGELAPVPTAFAVDGIDELLLGFAPHRPGVGRRLHTQQPRTLLVRPDDVEARWLVHIGTDLPRFTRHAGDADDLAGVDAADVVVSGGVGDIYLWVWNRPSPAAVTVTGDAALAALWAASVRIR